MRHSISLIQASLLAFSATLAAAEFKYCGNLFNIGECGWGVGSWNDFSVLRNDLCDFGASAGSGPGMHTVQGKDGEVSYTLQAGDQTEHCLEAVQDIIHNCFDSDKTQTNPDQSGLNSAGEYWSSTTGVWDNGKEYYWMWADPTKTDGTNCYGL